MKKAKVIKLFLAELENNPNISVACKRVGIARQTVYRWKREDHSFDQDVEEAMALGVESKLDHAENQLAVNVANGNQRAIEKTIEIFGKHSDRYQSERTVSDPYKGKTLADLMLMASKARPKDDLPTV